MIYADASFLFSLYALDGNTPVAIRVYQADARRPLLFTPWQRLELRNTVRLAAHQTRRARRTMLFNVGNVLKDLDADLSSGVLRHAEPDWRETLRLAEEISAAHTEANGQGAVDTWHIAAAALLRADSFWTFDEEQAETALDFGRFKSVVCP